MYNGFGPLIRIGPTQPPKLYVVASEGDFTMDYKVGPKGKTISANPAEVIMLAAKRG